MLCRFTHSLFTTYIGSADSSPQTVRLLSPGVLEDLVAHPQDRVDEVRAVLRTRAIRALAVAPHRPQHGGLHGEDRGDAHEAHAHDLGELIYLTVDVDLHDRYLIDRYLIADVSRAIVNAHLERTNSNCGAGANLDHLGTDGIRENLDLGHYRMELKVTITRLIYVIMGNDDCTNYMACSDQHQDGVY